MPRNKRKNLARAIEHRAEKNADIRLGSSVAAALLGSQRVAKALTLIDGPAAPRAKQEECGAMCLPQVAMFNAGHRKTTNVTAR
ncbi:transcriptional regulator [Serratia fonticola]|uniref:transcriptional antitermination N peptide n=1 Tax=Serratia fonticola TaxID=47917 RepID=UPI003AAD7606